jgi:predicted porin
MKKSLIALAALAAFGTASAQSTATISGKFGAAYSKGLGSVGNLGVSDGNVTVAAVEDLGGGLKAGVSLDMRVRGRENVVGSDIQGGSNTNTKGFSAAEVGRDATVYLSGAFGTVTAGSIEAGNGITGNGWAGTTVTLAKDLNNGGVLSSNAYGNLIQYTSPAFNGLTVNLTRLDSIAKVGVTNSVNDITLETTTLNEVHDVGVNANVVGATYANGPLTAALDYTMFGDKTIATAKNDRNRMRVSAAYDLGVVKLGFGMEDNTGTVYTSAYVASTTASLKGRQTTFGVSAPIGNLRVGVVYTANTESGIIAGATANGDEKATAVGFGADYSFSKRTVLNASYADIKRTGGATWSAGGNANSLTAGYSTASATNSGSQYRVRLMHSF